MATIALTEHLQRPNLGAEIELFIIDGTRYGAGIHRLVSGDAGSVVHAVTFDGEDYMAWPVKSQGWGVSADGTMPRPTLAIGNQGDIFTPLVVNNSDLKECPVTRIRTYERYLDDGEDPDPTQTLPIDVYKIGRMVNLTDNEIQWELVSYLDQQDVLLPGRTVVRDYCSHTYRVWNGSAFVYENATCPYNGSDYFDRLDDEATNATDVCGKRLSSCRARFGDLPLPFMGFPGVARTRTR